MTALSAETFAFLGELAQGRDKPWFERNRQRYEEHLLAPMRALVEAITPRLRAHIPDLEDRPQINKTLTRMTRDMRFSRGQRPYKDHMLALFYRQHHKRDDPQLFVGVQPKDVWVGLYLAPSFIANDTPMARAVAGRPADVVALGRAAGIGADLDLASCHRYGEISQTMDGAAATDYVTGPHLCALRVLAPADVSADPTGFIAAAGDILERLVPLRRAYLEGI